MNAPVDVIVTVPSAGAVITLYVNVFPDGSVYTTEPVTAPVVALGDPTVTDPSTGVSTPDFTDTTDTASAPSET